MKCQACGGAGSDWTTGRFTAVCARCGGMGEVFVCPVCKVPIERVVRTERLTGEVIFEATCHGQTRSFVFTRADCMTLPVWLPDAIRVLVQRVEGLFAPAEIGILPDGRKV